MDFMTKYSKELVSTAKNINDEEPNLNRREINSDLNAYLKSKETQYQKIIRDQLAKKNMLRIKEAVTPVKINDNFTNINEVADTCAEVKTSDEEIKKEYEHVKNETSNLQEEAKKLVDDISSARETTMDALNSIMKELTQKIQTGNLIQ
ncbi:95L [Yaba monkey tumor virus]|uniref:39kDa core protein OPG130 n=1 Tax=Yaba monkey tumor virus (strain VR587) TaxID=928314 RepID=Q6TUS3_YMTV5|nr:virion core protein [Yaba monkey tumor virus]AAR07451.1 95L [Yaba monkey tumor virus]